MRALAHVVGTTSLDDSLDELLLVDVVVLGELGLDGEIPEHLLHVGLVDGDLGLPEDAGLGASPGDEDELGALRLLVTSGHAKVGELASILVEVAGELIEAAGTGGLEDDLVLGILVVTGDGPV